MIKVVRMLESGSRGQDRLAVEHLDDRVLLVVADGAGGTGGGALAAQQVCSQAVSEFRRGASDSWEHRLRRIDATLMSAPHGGMSTAVVVEIIERTIMGASVGDSGAWLVTEDELVDLTARQARKPLLGSGISRPVAFGPETFRGRLLLATDGLFKYAARDRMLAAMKMRDPEIAVAKLIDAARLKSGALQDDVAVLLCDEIG